MVRGGSREKSGGVEGKEGSWGRGRGLGAQERMVAGKGVAGGWVVGGEWGKVWCAKLYLFPAYSNRI